MLWSWVERSQELSLLLLEELPHPFRIVALFTYVQCGKQDLVEAALVSVPFSVHGGSRRFLGNAEPECDLGVRNEVGLRARQESGKRLEALGVGCAGLRAPGAR